LEETNPINGDDMGAVAENLIMEVPKNQDQVTDEEVEAILDTETEAEEKVAEDVDVDDVSDIDDEIPDTEDVEELEPTVEPETYMVKVDGQEQEVTLDELKRGYSGQKYIQKGMTEVAENRKNFDKLQNEVSQERQVLKQMLEQVQNGAIPVIPEYPPKEMQETDLLGYNMKTEEYRRAVEQRQQWEQNAKWVAERDLQERDRLHAESLNQQAMRLAEWMPEFKDETKRQVFVKEMTESAKEHYKLTDDQISTVQTAEEVMILSDAIKWRKLQANKPTAKKKAEGARPVVKPAAKRSASAAQSRNKDKALDAMKRSGSADDVANWLLS
tara:strand:+ start:2274 stop:3257 length:984 start_codon:yes stop_codon:yes gene_type:complete